jgi:hypothetical protein
MFSTQSAILSECSIKAKILNIQKKSKVNQIVAKVLQSTELRINIPVLIINSSVRGESRIALKSFASIIALATINSEVFSIYRKGNGKVSTEKMKQKVENCIRNHKFIDNFQAISENLEDILGFLSISCISGERSNFHL